MNTNASILGRPLRIGIDLLSIRPGEIGGGEMYVRSLVEALGRIDQRHEYYLFVTPRSEHLFAQLPERFQRVMCRFGGGRFELYKRVAWEWLMMRWQVRRLNLDVVHFPGNLVPPAFPVRTVLTVHDFSSLFYREHLPEVELSPATRLLDLDRIRSCVRADVMVAISGFSASEIERYTNADPARVHVVHLAGRDFEIPPRGEAEATVGTYGVTGRYVLSVATHAPHKNLPCLLEAFARVAHTSLRDHLLVLVGGGRSGEALQEQVGSLGIGDRVILTGYVPDDHIPAFYVAAEYFVLPSLYEGFGMPVLEAARCGTPVLASRAGSLPEIGGEAALLFDPLDVDDLAALLGKVAGDADLRARMSRLGRQRASQFDWNATARKMQNVYETVAGVEYPRARLEPAPP